MSKPIAKKFVFAALAAALFLTLEKVAQAGPEPEGGSTSTGEASITAASELTVT